jgi:hypothetical protein
VHGAVLLHIAAIGNNDLSPVATEGATRADVHVLSYNYITGYCRLGMHKGRSMHDRFNAIEFVKHKVRVLLVL